MKSIINKFKNSRNVPKKILLEALKENLKKSVRKYTIKFFPVKLSDKDFLKIFSSKDFDDLPPFFVDTNAKKNIIKTMKTHFSKEIQITIENADEICEHTFNLLGSGKIKMGEKIDWHTDFINGYRWDPKKYYLWSRGKYVKCYLEKGIHADVKVPWELSRCQHFITLGKAYWFTHNEKYAEEFANQVESWIKDNPVEMGVNWACTMDVAIRAVNWIWGYYFFYNSKSLDKKFKLKFFKNLYLHGRHISNNLEFGKISQKRNNHYIADIVGLVYIGLLFNETRAGKRWLEKGLTSIKEEIEFQINEDGTDFEGTTNYHRLVIELFLSAILLLKKNDIKISNLSMKKLEKMIDFVMYYSKPDGLAPVIADMDNGRLHRLGNNDINDHRYLLNLGAVMFNRSDFKKNYPTFNEESYWLLGENGYKKFKKMPIQESELGSKKFPCNGFFIMRDKNLYMFICGGYSKKPMLTTHLHNDALSFELFAADKTFIIDPGTYVYTSYPNWRNRFRSTGYHNTLVIDGKEQNQLDNKNVFRLKSFDAIVKVNKWETKKEHDLFDGEHYGYHKLKNPVTHRRKIYFDKQKKYWEITDILTGKGKHDFQWYFHFAPMKLTLDKKHSLKVKSECVGSNLEIAPAEKIVGMQCDIIDGFISNSYGTKIRAPVVRYTLNGIACDFKQKFLIKLKS